MRITNALERAVRVLPDAVAAIEGSQQRSWRQIGGRVARFASALAQRGISPQSRVAILADNGIAYFEMWYAVPWCGGIIVPLNTRLALPELDFQLRDADVALLLYDEGFASRAQGLLSKGSVAQIMSVHEDVEGCDPLPAYTGSSGLAGIFYTGGTTGLPKGVMLSHGNLTAMAMNLLAHVEFNPGDVLFHAAPMFHLADIGTLMGTMVTTTHIFRPVLDPAGMIEDFAEHGVTHCFTVPVMIERLTVEAAARGLHLAGLRYLGYGGSSMAAASIDRARAQFPSVRFIQGYGQTEFPAATFLTPEDHAPSADPTILSSCGRACFGYDIRIVDENGQDLPRGTVGEIIGRGDNIMMGYLGRPEETAAVLKNGWIHTRDAGWMNEDGYVFITDRLKDMIVTGAENVYSIEVENALSYHPAVAESAVIGMPDPQWGERVHAIIVLAEGQDAPDAQQLGDHCRDRIAGYKIPKSFAFRNRPLPRSALGKILKRALRGEPQEADQS